MGKAETDSQVSRWWCHLLRWGRWGRAWRDRSADSLVPKPALNHNIWIPVLAIRREESGLRTRLGLLKKLGSKWRTSLVGCGSIGASSAPYREHWAQVLLSGSSLSLPRSHTGLCASLPPGPRVHRSTDYKGSDRTLIETWWNPGMYFITFSTCILRAFPGCSHPHYLEA